MSSTDIVIHTIEQFFRDQFARTPPWTDKPLAVAVSGGLDSMVLLHALKTLADSRGGNVHAVHVNHGIRASAADDAEFVQQVGRAWGVPVTLQTVFLQDIPSEHSRGLEADARELRYRALRRVAHQLGTDMVFLAHHADDQLETILWRLVRGTTLTGAAGLRPAAKRDDVTWLRPLLQVEKSDLGAYATENDVPHVEDQSNEDTRFTRNYLRHYVVPHLKQLQPGVAKHVVQFAQMAAEEDNYLEGQARAWVEQFMVHHPTSYQLPIPQLLALARPLQRRVIKIILFYCLASENWTRAHVDGILSILEGDNPSALMSLHRDLSVRREYETLVFGELSNSGQSFSLPWRPFDGSQIVISSNEPSQTWTFACRMWNSRSGTRLKSKYELLVPVVHEVVVQPPRTSERLALLGSTGTKKVQDIFVDNKVPKHQRPTWPALYYEEQLIWIPGLARSRLLLVYPERHETGWLITGTPPIRS